MLIAFAFIILTSPLLLANWINAQEQKSLKEQTLYEITDQKSSEISSIKVGGIPTAIGLNTNKAIAYVLKEDGSISVIDMATNTRIKEIREGLVSDHPLSIYQHIGVIARTDKVYIGGNVNDTSTVSVIDGKILKKDREIRVDDWIEGIDVNFMNNTVYVAMANGNVSVLDGKNLTKVGEIEVEEDIVHSGIGVGHSNKIYVAMANGNVSVFDGNDNYKKVGEIEVGEYIDHLEADVRLINVYVAMANGNVSVFDGKNLTKVGEIEVGGSISDIYILSLSAVYVTERGGRVAIIDSYDNNYTKIGEIKIGGEGSIKSIVTNTGELGSALVAIDDGTIAVVELESKKVVARVSFNIEPFNSGHIECEKDKLTVPLMQQLYIYDGSKCIAKSNPGFEFTYWQEDLDGNSTRFIQYATPSPFDPVLDFLHIKHDKPEATLQINQFGNFTANFKELPPPLPPEYVATLFTVVISAFVGSWLTPTVIEWRKSRNQGNKLEYYHNKIKDLRVDGKLDQSDTSELDRIRNDLTDDYTRGKITKDQFEKLLDEISINYRELFNSEFYSLGNSSDYDKENKYIELKNSIEDSFATGKINEVQYNLLKEKLSQFE